MEENTSEINCHLPRTVGYGPSITPQDKAALPSLLLTWAQAPEAAPG